MLIPAAKPTCNFQGVSLSNRNSPREYQKGDFKLKKKLAKGSHQVCLNFGGHSEHSEDCGHSGEKE